MVGKSSTDLRGISNNLPRALNKVKNHIDSFPVKFLVIPQKQFVIWTLEVKCKYHARDFEKKKYPEMKGGKIRILRKIF